jgi:hypothetical protein
MGRLTEFALLRRERQRQQGGDQADPEERTGRTPDHGSATWSRRTIRAVDSSISRATENHATRAFGVTPASETAAPRR